jgi:hypothetical protein
VTKELKIIFPCLAAALLFSGCIAVDKKSDEKAKVPAEKKFRTPFPESTSATLKKNPDSKKKVKPAKKLKKNPPVVKKVRTEKKSDKRTTLSPKALNRCLPQLQTSPFLKTESFVMCWQISGPYPMAASVIKAQGPAIIHHEFVPKEKKLTGFGPVPGGIKWKILPAPLKGPLGKINLDSYWKKSKGPAAAYAAASLYCPVEMKNLTLKTGSSDYIKIWINGKLEQTFNRKKRAGKFDQDSVKGINLHKGINYIVVKTLCFKAPWQFYLRFADAKGMPISILPTIAR